VHEAVPYGINPDAVVRLERDGRGKFKEHLAAMIKLSGNWKDDTPPKAEVVPITGMETRIFVQETLERMR
jgi:hypothetical protein